MRGVRVLVGTRKGAFVLTSDGQRQRWEVGGPHFAGWEIYHVKGSAADPDRIYAPQTSGWGGRLPARSEPWPSSGSHVRAKREASRGLVMSAPAAWETW